MTTGAIYGNFNNRDELFIAVGQTNCHRSSRPSSRAPASPRPCVRWHKLPLAHASAANEYHPAMSLGEALERLGGLLRSAGLSAAVVALVSARSFSHPTFAGRWSAWLFATILLALAGTVASWVFASRAWRRAAHDDARLITEARIAFNLAVALWGFAYLWSAWLEPERAARILELAPFGAETALPSILEWVALVLGTASAALVAAAHVKGRLTNAVVIVCTVAAALLLAEGIVRLRTAITPAVMGFPTSSSSAWVRRFVRLNFEGFRDSAHAVQAHEGVKRLLVVGDSFAFGWGITDPKNRFGEQLAALLSANGDQWESLNAARPDSATPQHLRFLDSMSRYRPTVAILLYVFNDIDYLSPVTTRPQPGRFAPVAILFKNSHLFQEAYVRLRGLTSTPEGATNPYLDERLLATHLEDITRFVGSARALGATVKVVPMDPEIVVAPSARKTYDTFVSHASAAGIPLCSLSDVFSGESFDALTVNALDRHPSERANRLAAEATAACLRASS